MKTTMTISIWIDRIGEPGHPQIVVSLDDEDHSTTLALYEMGEMDQALERAHREAAERGLRVVREEPEQSGQWVTA